MTPYANRTRPCRLAAWALSVVAAALIAPPPALALVIRTGSGMFERTEAAGANPEPQRVYYHRPAQWAPDGRIVFVMHGLDRDADRYLNEWRDLSDRHGFLLVVPEFAKSKFPGDAWYNFGGMVDEGGRPRPRAQWSFGVLDRVFGELKAALGVKRPAYSLYGHSAGAQFVHRFLLFAPSASVEMAVAANAGWYTLPLFTDDFPYGLKNSPADAAAVRAFLARPLVLQLGEADNDPAHHNLRRTPEADRQGLHRLARGLNYMEVGRREAARLGAPLAWRVVTVPGVGPSNGLMAAHAAAELFRP